MCASDVWLYVLSSAKEPQTHSPRVEGLDWQFTIKFTMKLFCKELKGTEVALNSINDDTQISEIKKQIEDKLNIPGKLRFLSSGIQSQDNCSTNLILVAQQKLLFLGKILQDASQVKDYKIQDGAKLMLTRVPKPDLKKLLYTQFSRFYDSDTSNQMANFFIENMKQKLNDYSIDDLERLAEVFLNESGSNWLASLSNIQLCSCSEGFVNDLFFYLSLSLSVWHMACY